MFGTEYLEHSGGSKNGEKILVKAKQRTTSGSAAASPMLIECNALVGADGVGSKLR